MNATYPTLRALPSDKEEQNVRDRFLKSVRRSGFIVMDNGPQGLQLVPEWVYQHAAGPSVISVVASHAAAEDHARVIESLRCAIDFEFEARTDDGRDAILEALRQNPANEKDVLATKFTRAKTLLRSAKASELLSVLGDILEKMRASGGFQRFLIVRTSASKIVQLETAYRNLMSIERWGWRASSEAAGGRNGVSALGLTGSLLQLAASMIAYPLTLVPFVRGMVFVRPSFALVGIFRNALSYERLEQGQECVERMMVPEAGAFGGVRRQLQAVPNEQADEVEKYYRWFTERVNALYAVLWNPENFASREYPFSEQLKTYVTINGIVRDVANLRLIRDGYLTMKLSFGVIDRIANALADDANREMQIARRLLSRAFFEHTVSNALQKIPTALGELVAALGSYSDAETKVWESIRYPTLVDKAKRTVTIPNATPSGPKTFTASDFAEEFFRQARNSAHGFCLRNDRFENVLSITTGEIPPELPHLADAVWHALLVEPEQALLNGWGL